MCLRLKNTLREIEPAAGLSIHPDNSADRHAHYSALAVIASSLDKYCLIAAPPAHEVLRLKSLLPGVRRLIGNAP